MPGPVGDQLTQVLIDGQSRIEGKLDSGLARVETKLEAKADKADIARVETRMEGHESRLSTLEGADKEVRSSKAGVLAAAKERTDAWQRRFNVAIGLAVIGSGIFQIVHG
jgi:hypothetical protein